MAFSPDGSKVEIIHLPAFKDVDGWYREIRMAIGGTPVVPFDVHAASHEQFPSEQEWLDYLTRCAYSNLEQFGPAGQQRSDA